MTRNPEVTARLRRSVARYPGHERHWFPHPPEIVFQPVDGVHEHRRVASRLAALVRVQTVWERGPDEW
jgi:hypothetical protein